MEPKYLFGCSSSSASSSCGTIPCVDTADDLRPLSSFFVELEVLLETAKMNAASGFEH